MLKYSRTKKINELGALVKITPHHFHLKTSSYECFKEKSGARQTGSHPQRSLPDHPYSNNLFP